MVLQISTQLSSQIFTQLSSSKCNVSFFSICLQYFFSSVTRLCLGGFFGSLFFLFQKKILLEVLWDSWICGLLVFINFEKYFLQTFLSLFSFSDFSYIYIRPSDIILQLCFCLFLNLFSFFCECLCFSLDTFY